MLGWGNEEYVVAIDDNDNGNTGMYIAYILIKRALGKWYIVTYNYAFVKDAEWVVLICKTVVSAVVFVVVSSKILEFKVEPPQTHGSDYKLWNMVVVVRDGWGWGCRSHSGKTFAIFG